MPRALLVQPLIAQCFQLVMKGITKKSVSTGGLVQCITASVKNNYVYCLYLVVKSICILSNDGKTLYLQSNFMNAGGWGCWWQYTVG